MATWNMYNLMDSTSPLSDNLILFHNLTMILMFMIIMMTLSIILNIILNKFLNRFLLKNHNLEMIWTITPMIMLIFIALPSLKTLYFIDEIWTVPYLTIKAIGHQWYWTYEYSDFWNIYFDSYMINNLDNLDLFRLLDVDNRIIIPLNTPIRLITTSMDVIHSWTIPSMGIKLDATPGRINQGMIFTYRPGLFFGQCSEICGTNHSFMPIVIEATNSKYFMNWLKCQL